MQRDESEPVRVCVLQSGLGSVCQPASHVCSQQADTGPACRELSVRILLSTHLYHIIAHPSILMFG